MYKEDLRSRGERPRLSLSAACALYFVVEIGLVLLGFLQSPLANFWKAVFPAIGEEALTLLVEALYYLLCMLLPAALMLGRQDAWESARVKPIRPLSMLAVVALALVGLFLVQYMSVLWTLLLEALRVPYLNVEAAMPGTTGGMMLMVISMGVLPGVCEEVVFRGAILSAFERKGTKRAIVISALLFTVLHGSLAGLPMQFFLGLVLGYVVFAFDSIYAGIAYHTVHNAAIVILNAAMPTSQEAEARILEQGTFAYLGGWPGVFQVAMYTALLAWAMWSFIRAIEIRRRARGVRALPPRRARLSAGARAALGVTLLVAASIYFFGVLAVLA